MLELNFNPFPGLETERLLLKHIELTSKNIDDIFKLRSDMDAMRFIGKTPSQSREEAEDLIQRMLDDLENNNGIGWGIYLKISGNLIGTIGYHRIQKANYRAEIGYMLMPLYWKQGIMSEAMKIIIDYGFNILKFHSIEANIDPRNVASETLLKKFGFVKEAHLKENYFFNGEFLDSAIYSLLHK